MELVCACAGAPHLLREQDGSPGRRLLQLREDGHLQPGRAPLPHPGAISSHFNDMSTPCSCHIYATLCAAGRVHGCVCV